ncbi:2-hydroxyacid dehydrogenase [Spirosoma gilvum]
MNIAFFSALPFEQTWFERYAGHHQLTYITKPLNLQTAELAKGHRAVCAFVNDDLSRPVLRLLKQNGISIVGMRSVGLDNVDQEAIAELNMTLLQMPGHSPYSVAEQTVTLLLGLIRHLPEAHNRVQAGDFSIDGLVGNDLHGKTVGIVGTGRIGKVVARIMLAFGCNVLACDIRPDQKLMEAGVRYVLLPNVLQQADIISLHCPLTPQTYQLVNGQSLSLLKPDAILVNTARGRLVDTEAVLIALDGGRLAGYAADVYENEQAWFHYDYSGQPITDELLNRLRTNPKVLLTAHQAFLTQEALQQTARNLLNQFSFYDNQQTRLVTKASMC